MFGGPERSAITAARFQAIGCVRVLVLVDQAERVAELVQDDPAELVVARLRA